MMMFKALAIGLYLMFACSAHAGDMQDIIDQAMAHLTVKVSDDPYSRTIEKMLIGYDAQGAPKIGIAYREIESFKPVTGVVIVEKNQAGFVLRKAIFPDIGKIKNAKDRKQVLTVLKQFKDVPFDPHAEKSAVDGLSGATRYGIKTSGYLNYMARRTALEMESKPNWPEKK
jgi:hypothetical protein